MVVGIQRSRLDYFVVSEQPGGVTESGSIAQVSV